MISQVEKEEKLQKSEELSNEKRDEKTLRYNYVFFLHLPKLTYTYTTHTPTIRLFVEAIK